QHDLGFEVMVRAVLKLGGAAGRAMSRRGRGWIIDVGSVSALVTQNNYSAIKAWVGNYSESLGVQLARTRVHVTALMPGWLRAEFHSRAGIKGSPSPGCCGWMPIIWSRSACAMWPAASRSACPANAGS